MIVIAWTALFHAIFYKRNQRPWYRKTVGKSFRYIKVDGEPKHWELSECLGRYFGSNNPPERRNLEFLIQLRNKIEHRYLPELDASLYGECQAALMNLEEMLVAQFGKRYALVEHLAIALQFSQVVPPEKKAAAKTLVRGHAKSVADYIERFRGSLPSAVLSSMKYSYSVFLVPRVVNRQSAADAAVQFIRVDEARPEELERLSKLNVLIKEKHIPIANLDLFKPTQVVREVKARLGKRFTTNAHTRAWKHYAVRPPSGSTKPAATRGEFCVYDPVHKDYLYTRAWIDHLVRELSDDSTFRQIVRSGTTPRLHGVREPSGEFSSGTTSTIESPGA